MKMEEQTVLVEGSSVVEVKEVKLEEDEDEFRSCCEDEDELKEKEESKNEDLFDNFEADSVKIYFKGVSVVGPGDSSSRLSGIGVVIERSGCTPPIRVQKKLDFYVDELVADYLALLDGLSEAKQNNFRRVLAFTNSEILYDQVSCGERLEDPLMVALRERIVEHASNMDAFALNFVPSIDLEKALQLAQVAIGIVISTAETANGDKLTDTCAICCETKLASMMVTIKCSHTFCSYCMKTYVEGKVQSTQVPIRCPQLMCKYCISVAECRSFLPVTSYESLEQALAEANILNSDKIYCPYPNCSVLLDPHECLSTRASSSSQPHISCVECPVCQRFICADCEVPWHSSMTCEEYQNIPLEERDACDLTLHCLAQNKRWRRCQQCRRMIELTHGCYHMTCLCRNEFCYSCGADYRHGQQTCQCAFWDEDFSDELEPYPVQQEQWTEDSFESLPMLMDAYSDQDRSQLAVIQRFLSEGFSLTDHNPYQSPPRCMDSYVEAIKDLQQLPWLEGFVSLISDNYNEDYMQ